MLSNGDVSMMRFCVGRGMMARKPTTVLLSTILFTPRPTASETISFFLSALVSVCFVFLSATVWLRLYVFYILNLRLWKNILILSHTKSSTDSVLKLQKRMLRCVHEI
jgi:hypothetical protein